MQPQDKNPPVVEPAFVPNPHTQQKYILAFRKEGKSTGHFTGPFSIEDAERHARDHDSEKYGRLMIIPYVTVALDKSIVAIPVTVVLVALSLIASTASAAGPGTEMTRTVNRMGLGSDCGRCKALAAEMDAKGPQWVRQNLQHVVGRTVSNAEALGHRMGPIKRAGVRWIVRRSVRRAR